MAQQRSHEGTTVARGQRANLFLRVRMAADGPLPVHDEGAGEDVGAFHGDADGGARVTGGDQVPRPAAQSRAAHHVP